MNILFNEAMKIERSEYLGAAPYQRTAERKSYANGCQRKKKSQVPAVQGLAKWRRRESNEKSSRRKALQGKSLRHQRIRCLHIACTPSAEIVIAWHKLTQRFVA